MANKKINELDNRASLSLSDLMAVGDPSTGYLYKTTISDLKTLTGAGVISFNGRFGAVVPAEGDYSLTQLSDVIITTAANGNIIKYNGSNWVNVPMYTGTIAQYVDGTGAYQTFPTLLSSDRLITEVRNTTGATVTKGTVVYLNGSSGTLPTIAKAQANSEATSSSTYGVVQNDIANNANGYVVVIGNLTGIDTSAYTAGDILWLSPTVAGGVTTTKPVAPNNAVYVGIVTRSNNSAGTIEVKIQNGYELDELHNVLITSVANNDGLFWDSATSLWKNKSISTVLGYTPQAQLNGTGFVKASGTTITYDNSTYVTTNTSQTISGVKIFSSPIYADEIVLSAAGTASQTFLKNLSTAGTVSTGANLLGFNTDDNFYLASDGKGYAVFSFNNPGTGYTYTLPALSGTVALTSNLSSYLPLAGGTLSGNLTLSSASTPLLQLVDTTNSKSLLFGADDNNTFIRSSSSTPIIFQVNGGDTALTLASSKAATFADNIFIGAGKYLGYSATAYMTPEDNIQGARIKTGGGFIVESAGATLTTQLKVSNSTGTALDMLVLETGFSNPSGNKSIIWKDASNTLGRISVDYDASYGSRMTFGSLYNAGYQTSNLMTIMGSGKVGIGTNAPTSLLTTTNGNVEIQSDGSSSMVNYLKIGTHTNGNWGSYIGASSNYGSTLNTDLRFGVSNGGTSLEAIRITSSGSVGIGTSFPVDKLDVYNGAIHSRDSVGSIYITTNGGGQGVLAVNTANPLRIFTNGSERVRITSLGFLKASDTGSYGDLGGLYHELLNSNGGNNILAIKNTASSNPYGVDIAYTNSSPNNDSNNFIYTRDSSTARFVVRANGGIANYQSNNTNLSDERTKKEISPLESYWDKFKAIEIVKFKYKDQTHDDFNIGVIAQQVEAVAPEFVDVDGWNNKPELNDSENVDSEDPLKSIYTADLHHATIKVLQEAMAKIESQQAQIEDLKARLN